MSEEEKSPTKIISVPTAWTVFEVPDGAMQILSSGAITTPPHLVIELMVLAGKARKIGVVTSPTLIDDEDDAGEVDDHPGNVGEIWGPIE
jgi:hypothetical protein